MKALNEYVGDWERSKWTGVAVLAFGLLLLTAATVDARDQSEFLSVKTAFRSIAENSETNADSEPVQLHSLATNVHSFFRFISQKFLLKPKKVSPPPPKKKSPPPLQKKAPPPQKKSPPPLRKNAPPPPAQLTLQSVGLNKVKKKPVPSPKPPPPRKLPPPQKKPPPPQKKPPPPEKKPPPRGPPPSKPPPLQPPPSPRSPPPNPPSPPPPSPSPPPPPPSPSPSPPPPSPPPLTISSPSPPPAGPAPGPSCGGIGKCCSNKPQEMVPPGTAMMPSTWMSTQMAHGAKIQIREPTWNRWWVPEDGLNWNGIVRQNSYSQPPVTVYFTVIRITDDQIKLRTMDGSYVYPAPPDPTIAACCGIMSTTTDSTDPATILTVAPVPERPSAVYLKASDGYWISGDSGGYLFRWSWWTPSNWEMHDILEVTQVPSIRGPNVGSWLAIERWMIPNLYSDPVWFNDGTSVQIKSVGTGKYVSSGDQSSSQITCNYTYNYETFYVQRSTPAGGDFRFKTKWFQFWSMSSGKGPIIMSDVSGVGVQGNEDFTVIFKDSDYGELALIQAPNGKYLRAWSNGNLTADVDPATVSLSNPATWTGNLAFIISNVGSADGEWQFSYELGSQAAQTFTSHHDTFFQESDWVYLRDSGANSIRLPIGWWVMDQLPFPRSPGQNWTFAPNATKYLDWAFQMGQKYSVRIFISIHGAAGSQSGWGNTGTQSGMVEWHLPENVAATLTLVDWLCKRYVSNPYFLGISLLNEPVSWGVPNQIAQDYYSDAYDIVRSYSQCLYVAISARIGSNEWNDVIWHMNDALHTNVMVEVHAYDVFGGFGGATADAEIAWVKTERLKQITDLQATGRTVLVGEFSNAMATWATPEQQAAFSLAQIKTFGAAINGWFFWSLKLQRDGYDHWNWYRSLAKGWLPKNSLTSTWY